MAVYANPSNACQKIQGPPNNTDYNGNWIVLIRRYNCSFEIKVRMAQEAGYDAVIVHNVNSNELGKLNEYYIIIKISMYIKRNLFLFNKIHCKKINSRTNVSKRSCRNFDTSCICW